MANDSELQDSVQQFAEQREIHRMKISVGEAANKRVTEFMQQVQQEQNEAKVEIQRLRECKDDLIRTQQYAESQKLRLSSELEREDSIMDGLNKLSKGSTKFDYDTKLAEIEQFNVQFSEQLKKAPWLPEKRAILNELKQHEDQMAHIQEEMKKMDAAIAELEALLAQHDEIPFKKFCLSLANYVPKIKEYGEKGCYEMKTNVKLNNIIKQQKEPRLDGGQEANANNDAVQQENGVEHVTTVENAVADEGNVQMEEIAIAANEREDLDLYLPLEEENNDDVVEIVDSDVRVVDKEISRGRGQKKQEEVTSGMRAEPASDAGIFKVPQMKMKGQNDGPQNVAGILHSPLREQQKEKEKKQQRPINNAIDFFFGGNQSIGGGSEQGDDNVLLSSTLFGTDKNNHQDGHNASKSKGISFLDPLDGNATGGVNRSFNFGGECSATGADNLDDLFNFGTSAQGEENKKGGDTSFGFNFD